MPAPILAAASTVANFIARHGVTKAVKKYGQRAVTEARKHMKDMKTKKTPGQAKSEPATKGQRTYRSGQRKAGVGGAGVGSGVTAGIMSSSGEQDYTAANVDLNSGSGLPVADMSRSIDVRGEGSGIKYYQDGKQVRMPKKNYN